MFEGVMWEDSWLLGWRHEDNRLIFTVEASLWPGHPAYEAPRPGEWTCYKRGRLVFEAVRSVDGLPGSEGGTPPYADASGERDFGSIDHFSAAEGGYRLGLDFADVLVQCETVRLEFDSA